MTHLDKPKTQREENTTANQEIDQHWSPDQVVQKINQTYHAYLSVRINILASENVSNEGACDLKWQAKETCLSKDADASNPDRLDIPLNVLF